MYATTLNEVLLRLISSGLDIKISNDLAWDLQRSDARNLLDSTKSKSFSFADVVERKLNLADTEGMFLLMAVGYTLAGSVLVSEMVGGCARTCRQFVRRKSSAVISYAKNTSRRESVATDDNNDGPVNKPRFSVNLRRRLSGGFPNNRSDLSLAIKKFLKRSLAVAENIKDEEKADIDDQCGENHFDEYAPELIENEIEDYKDRNEKDVDGTFVDQDAGGKDGERDSFQGSSSISSKSCAIREEHTVEVNTSSRDENPSKEFGEVVNHL